MDAPVVVVGAGGAGLAMAATLAQRGIAYRLLERSDAVGAAWRERYDSLRLHTARTLSGLPGLRIPRRYGPWVARDDLVSYFEDYATRFGLDVEFGVDVERVDRDGSGWSLTTSAGPVPARVVVIATGYTRVPFLPAWPGMADFQGSIAHSGFYRMPEPFRGRRVLVVGAGNSGAEIASELTAFATRVDVSVRTPPNIIRRSTAGVPSQAFGIALDSVPDRLANPIAAAFRRLSIPDLTDFGLPGRGDALTQARRTRTVPILDHGFVSRVRSGAIRIVAAVQRFSAQEVHLADGTAITPDAVIAATGYRPGLRRMVGHLGVLDDSGMPVVRGSSAAVEAPGLYFVGIHVTLVGLLREIGREATGIADTLASRPITR